ncbi:hypothetical protein [Gemmata sp.]|uniref:hypothetical protein n=1 Tax=Gemmata sp. TaxID=1914242 RepID=UPI003F72C2AF
MSETKTVDPNVERVDALLAKLRGDLLAADLFAVDETRPVVRSGYTEAAPGRKFVDWAPGPVSVVTITISHQPSDDEVRRQLAGPPNKVA